jgi:hypothetical protein
MSECECLARTLYRSLTPRSKESDGSASLPLRELALKVLPRLRIAFAEPRQVALSPQRQPSRFSSTIQAYTSELA